MDKAQPTRVGSPIASAEAESDTAACFHCGEPCNDLNFQSAEKTFCCHGCLIVHDLLTESGLGQFYELSDRPGIRARQSARRDQWLYLDDPALQQRLLDFTDGKISRITFHVPSIHCIACVWLLENLARLHPGIVSSRVNFPRREVAIGFDVQKIKLSEAVTLLASIGYEPALALDELKKRASNPSQRRQWLQVGVAGFAFGNIMLFSLPTYLGMDSFNEPIYKPLFGYLSLALALPVLCFSAADYWKSAWVSLRQRVLTLDVPIALGLAALYAESAFAVVSGRGENYLDSMAGLIFFLLCGRVFQQKTHERLAFDRDYTSFFPLSVTRKNASGTDAQSEEQIPLSELRVGDRIIVRNGELIPSDATLISPTGCIDYSFVTGESEAVARIQGEHLYAGGKQIGAAIEVQTVKPVSQSYLTSLWNHETFQKERNDDFNTLTNRYSRRFTRVVIAIAVIAALAWIFTGDAARGLKAFTSVLIVACPCALALAAPFTLGTAQRLLGRSKVFLKNALVLERMARVETIVFDKTGTLTARGTNATVFDGTPLSSAEENWIYSITRHSMHPLSARITESLAAKCLTLAVDAFKETPGRGIEGIVQGRKILAGSRLWLESHGVKFATPAGLSAQASTAEFGSGVHVAIENCYRGAFALSGALRPDTDKLLRELPAHYEIALLSGDNERERETFRHLFGSKAQLLFNQSPFDKLSFIRGLQESGRTVMMVGDGLNDAGALRQSDVGVAVIEKVGTFSPASDVILEAVSVPQLSEILMFARRSARIVRASFLVSGAYNLLGITIAAMGWLSPLVCAVLMPVSSISVVVFACGMTAWMSRRTFAKRAPRVSQIPSLHEGQSRPSGALLRFPTQAKKEVLA
ncbi:MAG: heavy metal translocating P-type ATPase [Verrucomicrobiota bacterium]